MISAIEADELAKSFQGKLIDPAKVRGLTNRFILEHLRDRFCAGKPNYALMQTDPIWIVPILFAQSDQQITEVGEVIVQAISGEIIGFSPPAEVLRNARAAIV